MAHEHNERCEEIQKALGDVRAKQTQPPRGSTLPGIQGGTVVDPGDVEPDGSPEVDQEIRNLEKLLRDMGCEPR